MRSVQAVIAGSAILGVIMGFNGCGSAPPEKKPPPLPVTTVKAETQEVPDIRNYPGNTDAIYEAYAVARVQGYLEERFFEEGEDVEEGEVLFRIQQPPFEAEVLVNQGKVLDAEVQLGYARTEYKRNEPLTETGAISEQEWDGYVRNLESAIAQLESAQGALIQSQINLDYTEVQAPFSGRIGRRLVSVGNLVGPGENENLAYIVQLDPMRIIFEPAGTELVDYLKAWPAKTVPVTVTFQSTSGPEVMKGALDLVDNTLNSGTSTFMARAQFSNPNGVVLPGLFGDVEVNIGSLGKVVVVPSEAINSELQSHYVWSVNAKNELERVSVTLGRTYKGMRIVTGLKSGTSVVVAGNPMGLRPNTPVKPTSMTIEAYLKEQSDNTKKNRARTKGEANPSSSKTDGTKDASSKSTSSKSEKSSTTDGKSG